MEMNGKMDLEPVSLGIANPSPTIMANSNPSSPKVSLRKLDVRSLSSETKTRKESTSYHPRTQGTTKRSPPPSLPENKLVRKKIIFDNSTCSISENDGELERRSSRPGPFEAYVFSLEMASGELPLLAQDLKFTVGATEGNLSAEKDGETVSQVAGFSDGNNGGLEREKAREEHDRSIGASNDGDTAMESPSEEMSQVGHASNMCAGSHEHARPTIGNNGVVGEGPPREPGSIVVCKLASSIIAVEKEETQPTRLTHLHQYGNNPNPLLSASAGTATCKESASTHVRLNESQTKNSCSFVNPTETNSRKKQIATPSKQMEIKMVDSNFPPLSKGWSTKVGINENNVHNFGDVLQPAGVTPAPMKQHTGLQKPSSPTIVSNGLGAALKGDATSAVTYTEKVKEALGAAATPSSPPLSRVNGGSKFDTLLNPLTETAAATNVGFQAPTPARAPEPVAFDLEKLKKIGTAGVSDGIPSISFSI